MRNLRYIIFLFCLSNAFFGQAQDNFSLFNRKKEPQTVKELTANLIAGKTSDSLKIIAIYSWITENVSYDYSAFMSGEPIRYQSPELVFKRKKTTCTGYSNLMIAMLEYAGIQGYTVEGFTQDYVLGLDSTKLSSDHAWVAFKMDGRWFSADPTWDSGEIGVMRSVKKETFNKTFWQKLRSFKWKNLFKKKKRKTTKTYSREKVTYKIGFIRKPSRNYLFADPNEFLKTHLPNVAHIQMKSAPIRVEQFCDSSHALGDKKYISTGGFNYNSLNDAYFQLEIPERLLWLSDSSLNYHYLNHGDKALNAHNYLAHFYGGKVSRKDFIEKYISIADTVIIHGNLAININRQEFKKKKTLFAQAFQTEKKQNFAQQTQVNYIQKHIASNADIYRKGRDRITLKEQVAIDKWQMRIMDKFGFPSDTLPPKGYDTIPQVVSTLQAIHSMRDTILFYQKLENSHGPNYVNGLALGFYNVRMGMYEDAVLLYESQFLNEKQFLKKDKEVIDSLTLLTQFLRDSVNSYLGNRASFSLLMKMDQQLKMQEKIWANLQKKDSLFPAWEFYAYGHFVLHDLLNAEQEVMNQRLMHSLWIENTIKSEFKFQAKELGLDMKDLSYMKTARQAYLTKMMNNKYNRSIRVYTIIIKNAKNWKNQYKAKLKSMEE